MSFLTLNTAPLPLARPLQTHLEYYGDSVAVGLYSP